MSKKLKKKTSSSKSKQDSWVYVDPKKRPKVSPNNGKRLSWFACKHGHVFNLYTDVVEEGEIVVRCMKGGCGEEEVEEL